MALPPFSLSIYLLSFLIFCSLKEKLSDLFRRYPLLISAGIVAVVALIVFVATRHEAPKDEPVPEDVRIADTLALNILCLPTLECLPLYHALESGLCDSVGLSLEIHTEVAQFDIDSIMRRTRRIDGAVFDDYRLQYYRNAKRPLRITECMPLDGRWGLITSGKLRLREIAKLKKRIAASARYATSSNLLDAALKSGGLKTDQLYHAQINDFGIRTTMLDEAQVEIAMLPEPYVTIARQQGHRVVWSNDSVRSLVLAFRDKALKDKRKEQQVKALKKAYNLAVIQLNREGAHAADSALIKSYGLAPATIDSLRLPRYRKVKV